MRAWFVIGVLVLAACGETEGSPDTGVFRRDAGPPMDASAPVERILIDRVFDGDTVSVAATSTIRTPDGQPMNMQHIRLLGVDAPEIAHPEANPPRPNPDCWGDEAAQFANTLLAGKIITVEFDPQHTLRDDFGRLLGYVHLMDGSVANETLIRQGQAKSFRAFRHRDLQKYNGLEADAERENLGLWGACPN